MAEQLCVGALLHYTQTAVVDLARDGMVNLDVPDDGIDLKVWVEEHLSDGVVARDLHPSDRRAALVRLVHPCVVGARPPQVSGRPKPSSIWNSP